MCPEGLRVEKNPVNMGLNEGDKDNNKNGKPLLKIVIPHLYITLHISALSSKKQTITI